MTFRIDVFFLPQLVPTEELYSTAAVVIDVLRASTTMTAALHQGAASVIPCLQIDDALAKADELRSSQSQAGDMSGPLLAGERCGEKIEGFDLGNSPAEFTAEQVKGKVIVFSTTNGTKAIQHLLEAERILIAAFSNLSAVCRALEDIRRVAIVCAGTNGEITREDVLLAGAIVERRRQQQAGILLNDQALLASGAWQQACQGDLTKELATSRGGKNLTRLGMEADIARSAAIDCLPGLPEYDPVAGEIRLR